MYHTHSTSRPSAGDDLRAYGLAGIELHRATERREAEHQRDHATSTLPAASHMSSVRQRIGDALILLGSRLAGEAAKAPRVEPGVRPKIDMA